MSWSVANQSPRSSSIPPRDNGTSCGRICPGRRRICRRCPRCSTIARSSAIWLRDRACGGRARAVRGKRHRRHRSRRDAAGGETAGSRAAERHRQAWRARVAPDCRPGARCRHAAPRPPSPARPCGGARRGRTCPQARRTPRDRRYAPSRSRRLQAADRQRASVSTRTRRVRCSPPLVSSGSGSCRSAPMPTPKDRPCSWRVGIRADSCQLSAFSYWFRTDWLLRTQYVEPNADG